MGINYFTLFLVVSCYLAITAAVARYSERLGAPGLVSRYPEVFILSLAILTSAWSFYGMVDLAFQYGYGALAYYLGAGALFFFAPLALAPIAQLAVRFKIRNIADLMVFRFHSQEAGSLSTLCMLLLAMPLMAMQLQVMSDTSYLLSLQNLLENPEVSTAGGSSPPWIAGFYCIAIGLFVTVIGARREQSQGLIAALGLQSLVMLAALIAVGIGAVWGIYGGFGALNEWLQAHPENLQILHNPTHATPHYLLVLVFVGSVVGIPHIFSILEDEDRARTTISTLSWAFPLILLVMALPLFPILWAGLAKTLPLPTQYFTLGVPLQLDSTWMTLLTFLGGLSAASGTMVITALAISTMIVNHWLLPSTRLRRQDLYRRVALLRTLVISGILLLSFIFYEVIYSRFNLTDLAFMAFSETLQFMPALLAVTYWPKANSRGYICGLSLGTAVWLLGLIIPSIAGLESLSLPLTSTVLPLGTHAWDSVTLAAISLNLGAFILISVLTDTPLEERYSAELCAEDELSHPLRMILDVRSAEEFITQLGKSLGPTLARQEVEKALLELQLNLSERRPYALRRLRDKLEANLSGLVGTAVASEILDRQLPYHLPEDFSDTTDINMIENRLAQYRSHLTGLAAELNNLRLYHRNTLEELPLAACSLGQASEILLWNTAMEELTGIPTDQVVGSYLNNLPSPWRSLLNNFLDSDQFHLHKQQIKLSGKPHWLSLHKANIYGPVAEIADGQIILLEDMTETQLLEQELVHSERLASVGRLAAGVAHEIGNPVTGIDCLAQNLRYDADDPQAVLETAEQILSQTARVSRIVQSLVSFSHSGTLERTQLMPVSGWNCAEEAIQLLSLQKDRNQVNFKNEIAADILVTADPQKLIQVFINLLANARDASPCDSEVLLSHSETEDSINLHIIDAGEGIPKAQQDRVLEPFFTTKEPGKGTGLGLAMVYSIVEEFHGHLQIISPRRGKNYGTEIVVQLPKHLESKSQVVDTHTANDPAGDRNYE